MSTWEFSNPTDLDSLLIRLGIMGTNGGRDPIGMAGAVSLMQILLRGVCVYYLIDPADVPDNAFVLSSGYLGLIADDQNLDCVVARGESDSNLSVQSV